VIGIRYDDGFGFSDLDRIMFWAKFLDQDRIRILLKFFRADQIIKFQYPHNTGLRVTSGILSLQLWRNFQTAIFIRQCLFCRQDGSSKRLGRKKDV